MNDPTLSNYLREGKFTLILEERVVFLPPVITEVNEKIHTLHHNFTRSCIHVLRSSGRLSTTQISGPFL